MQLKFESYIKDQFPYLLEEKCVVCCSGGVDSIVLFYLMLSLHKNFVVAHCNFKLRDEESDDDEEFVKNICKQNSIEFYSKSFETKKIKEESNNSIQMIARDLRYGLFDEISTRLEIKHILTAHHLNDSLESFLIKRISEFNDQNIKLVIIGIKNFTPKLNKLLALAEKKTFKNKKIQINLALNYGAKSELTNAFKNLLRNKEKINEKNISKNLYTKNIPDPDLLIRTGNTKRLSNFLLWQLAYSEIFFEKKLWPDFNEKDFIKIIKQFKLIKRNFGNI